MKIRQFILFSFIPALIFTGCTSIYVKRNFPSEAFFTQINEHSGPADIIVKNDSVIFADNVKIAGNSLEWETSNAAGKSILPLKDIKAINYVHHWGNSFLFGAFGGMLIGGAVSGVLLEDETNPNFKRHPYMSGQWESDGMLQAIPGAVAGFLAGGIAGLVAGTDEYYSLDNSPSRQHVKYFNSLHEFGIKIGSHSILTRRSDDSYLSRITIKGVPSMAVSLFYNYPLNRFFAINSEISYLYSSSKTDFRVYPPGLDFERIEVMGKSEESLSILELSPALRINLLRSGLRPYLLLGPKLDILFPGKSGLSNSLDNIKSQYNIPAAFNLSSEYSHTVWGTILGAGISTGDIFPRELFIEGVFNLDFGTRITMHHNMDNIGLNYKEFQLNIGAAIF